jgi:hypothetical protein
VPSRVDQRQVEPGGGSRRRTDPADDREEAKDAGKQDGWQHRWDKAGAARITKSESASLLRACRALAAALETYTGRL